MPNLIPLHKLSVLLLGSFFLLSGCFNSREKVPFPSEDSEFARPGTRPLKLDEPITIEWRITDPDSIKPLPVKKFDLSKIPSKPFDIGEPLPLKAPMVETTFDWNSLPDTVFDLSNLPTQKLRFQTVLMAPPKISKAGLPIVKQGASRGVMDPGPGLGALGKCFLQDKSGALWIGTDKGLIRNDGINLETYSEEQGLPDEIYSLAEDKNGRIWIGASMEQVFVLDRKSGLLLRLIHSLSPGTLGLTFAVMEDRDGQMWIATGGHGVLIVDPKDQTVKHFGKKEGLANNFALRILQDRQGLVWLTTRNGVSIIDSKKKSNKHLSKLNGLEGDQFYAIIEDQEDDIWLGGAGGSHLINKEKGTIKRLDKTHGMNGNVFGLYQSRSGLIWMSVNSGNVFSFNKENNDLEKFIIQSDGISIYNIMEDHEGQIWMGSFRSGSFVINPNQGRPANFTTADGLGNNSVRSTIEARDGKIWIGARGGIDVYNPLLKTIQHIGVDQGLLTDNIYHLYEDKQGQIWVGGGNEGVSIIDEKAALIKHLTPAQGLHDRGINTFFEDSNDQMWMGCSRGGEIYVYNYSRRLLKTITNLTGFKNSGINAMKGDIDGRIWVSAFPAGIVIVDPNKNRLHYLNTKQGLSSNNVSTLLVDHNGNVLAGTSKGIDRVNLKKNTLTSLKIVNGLASDVIWTLSENKGKIYAGTSAGLSIISETQQGQEIVSYGRNQGLTYIDFYQNSSTFTSQNQFWAGVDNQILTVMDEPVKDTLRRATYVTGLHIFDKRQVFNNTNVLARQLETIDTLWKPEPGKFYQNKIIPVDSSSLQENGIKWDSIEFTYKMPINLRLPYDQNYLSFTFAGVHLSNPDKLRYRYILEGIDKMWSPISESASSENYRDLPPGDYTFKVSNKGMNGLWSEPAQFKFTIMPPWWQSWWAYTIYTLFFIGSVRAYIVFRSRLLKRQNQVLEEKVTHRTAQLNQTIQELKSTQSQLIQSEKMASLGELTAGIAHEIQNPLNFVNNFSEVSNELIKEIQDIRRKTQDQNTKSEEDEILNDITQNLEKINHHGKRASDIVKGMLQHSRTSSGQKELTDINALADEYLRLAYHGLRAKDKSFNATMKTEFDVSIGNINVVPQDIGRVILNLITNAFYTVNQRANLPTGQAGNQQRTTNNDSYEPTVTVSTKKLSDKIEIRVKDNGNGIPQKILDKIFQPFFTTKPTGQGTGLGLSLSYDIVTKVHQGEIKVTTKEGEGTAFIVILPM